MAMLVDGNAVMADARVRLVPLADKHLDATFRWVNDPAMMQLLGRVAYVKPDEHQRWFEQLQHRADCRYFSVETVDGGRHVGNIWLWDIDETHRKAEVRILFGDDPSRDRGYGSEAIALLADVAFHSMNLHRLYAYVFAMNPRAKRAFEKAGFRVEGLLRHDRRTAEGYLDTYVLGRVDADS